jgi:hypothetical protein
MSAHSCVIAPHLKGSIATVAEGKYGRMFPDLPGLEVDEEFLLALGRSGSVMDAASSSDENEGHTDNPPIPAAFAFLGQFIAHDITADRSMLQHHARLNELRNFRTPHSVVGETDIPEEHSLAYRDLIRGGHSPSFQERLFLERWISNLSRGTSWA